MATFYVHPFDILIVSDPLSNLDMQKNPMLEESSVFLLVDGSSILVWTIYSVLVKSYSR